MLDRGLLIRQGVASNLRVAVAACAAIFTAFLLVTLSPPAHAQAEGPEIPPIESPPISQIDADLSLTVTPAPSAVAVNENLTYTLLVENKSAVPALEAELTDTLDQPARVRFLSASPACEHSNQVVTCAVGRLDPDDRMPGGADEQSFTITVRARKTGDLGNLASVAIAKPQHDPNPGNSSRATSTPVGHSNPDLAVALTAPTSVKEDLETFTYGITATNVPNLADGVDNATGVRVDVQLPAGVTVTHGGGCAAAEAPNAFVCSTAELDESASTGWTITAEAATAGERDPETGRIEPEAATADVTAAEAEPSLATLGNNHSEPETTVLPLEPDLAATATASVPSVKQGETFTYTFKARNVPDAGNDSAAAVRDDATGITLSAELPAGVDVQPDSIPTECSVTGAALECNIASLPEGEEISWSVTVVAREPGTVQAAASVEGDRPDRDPDLTNNGSAHASTEIVPIQANLSVAMSEGSGQDATKEGQELDYTVTVVNTPYAANDVNGVGDDATGVKATIKVPEEIAVEIVVDSGCDSSDAPFVVCAMPEDTELVEGDTDGYSWTITVTPDLPAPDDADLAETVPIAATASVEGDQPDPVDTHDTDDEATNIRRLQPDLALNMAASPSPAVKEGELLTYTLGVTNLAYGDNDVGQFDDDATGVTIVDKLPAGVAYVDGSPSSPDCSATGDTATGETVTCTVGPLAEGDPEVERTIAVRPQGRGGTTAWQIVNEPRVSSDKVDNPGRRANNVARVSTTVHPIAPDLELTATDSPDPIKERQLLEYKLTAKNLKNTGDDGGVLDDDATGVTIVDTLPSGVELVSAVGCTSAGREVTCSVGSLAEDATVTKTIIVRVPNVDQISDASKQIENSASISGAQPDPDEDNNEVVAQLTTVLPSTPDLAVTQDAPTNVKKNDTFDYTITAANVDDSGSDGIDDATGVTIVDTLPSEVELVSADGCAAAGREVTCPIGDLPEGEAAEQTITVRARQLGTAIKNQVEIYGDQDEDAGDSVDNNTSKFYMSVDPASVGLELEMTGAPGSQVAENEDLVYAFTITNSGPQHASGVKVKSVVPLSFDLVGGDGCTDVAVPEDDQKHITCAIGGVDVDPANPVTTTMTVRAREPDSVPQRNIATVSADETDPDLGDNTRIVDTTVLAASPDLKIEKSDGLEPDESIVEGEQLTYTLEVENVQNDDGGVDNATGVEVTDVLPGTVEFDSADEGCEEVEGTVTCEIAELDEGEDPAIKRITVIPTEPTEPGAPLANTATVSGSEPDPVSGPGSNNSSTATTEVTAEADLSLTKTADAKSVVEGDELLYTLEVKNHGPSDATGVEITDALPANVDFVPSGPDSQTSPECSYDTAAREVTCTIGDLADGPEPVTRAITVIPTEPTDPDGLSNTATVSGAEPEPAPDPNSNSDTATTTVTAETDLSLTKTADAESVVEGDELVYTLTATNHGPSNATGVEITDVLPETVEFDSASDGCDEVDGTVTCDVGGLAAEATAEAQITVITTEPTEPGAPLSNTATVSGADPDPDSENNSSTATTAVEAEPAPEPEPEVEPKPKENEQEPKPNETEADATAPDTFLGADVKKTENTTPRFRFASSEEGSTFECRVDKGGWLPCTSPFTLPELKPGKHIFKVRALDSAGNTDATPARDTFKVEKPSKARGRR